MKELEQQGSLQKIRIAVNINYDSSNEAVFMLNEASLSSTGGTLILVPQVI